MGQHTIIVIPHDHTRAISQNRNFGEEVTRAIFFRENPNIPYRVPEVHNVQIGPQFRSNDTFLVSVVDGEIVRLQIDEQIYLEKALCRFRKKKVTQIA